MKLTIDRIRHTLVARDEQGNVVAERNTYCNPAALAQLIYDAEQVGEIDWENSQIARPRKNPAAVALGRRAKGVPKTITPAEREARRKRLANARRKRWIKPAV